MTYTYSPEGVCPSEIIFDISGNVVSNIIFIGGCDGNLKALSKLIDGMTIEEIEEKFANVLCKDKNTSCVGQLAIAVRQAAKSTGSVKEAGGAGEKRTLQNMP